MEIIEELINETEAGSGKIIQPEQYNENELITIALEFFHTKTKCMLFVSLEYQERKKSKVLKIS